MKRKLIRLGLFLSLVAPAFAQRGAGNRGSGNQVRQRIHQPGAGQQQGTAVQKRERKRDGTGPNCQTGPCLQQQTQTQTQTEVQIQTRTKTQQNKPVPKN